MTIKYLLGWITYVKQFQTISTKQSVLKKLSRNFKYAFENGLQLCTLCNL